MFLRLILGVGLFATGYYLGREVTRNGGIMRGQLQGSGRKRRVKRSIVDSTDYKVTENK
jgi:hypothetical protein